MLRSGQTLQNPFDHDAVFQDIVLMHHEPAAQIPVEEAAQVVETQWCDSVLLASDIVDQPTLHEDLDERE